MNNIYQYLNFKDENIISIQIQFVKMSKKYVGYDRGISIQIQAYDKSNESDSSEWRTICTSYLPFPISAGKILWSPLTHIEKRYHIDYNDLRKFCDRILKLKTFE